MYINFINKFSLSLAFVCSVVVAVADTKPVRNDRMGIAMHFGQGQRYEPLLPYISELGVGWIRDGIRWRDYEREPGVYRLPDYHREWLDAMHNAGIKVIMLLNIDNVEGNPIYKNNPFDPDAYARAAAALAVDVAGRAQVMEILNEPHGFGFAKYHGGTWNGWDGKRESLWVKKYVELLNKAAVAIKRANPEMKVIGLGASSPANMRMLKHGIVPEVDGLVDHPYMSRQRQAEYVTALGIDEMLRRDGIVTTDNQGTFSSLMQMYRDESAKYNGPKELWMTEWGFPTHHVKKQGFFSGRTEEAQAKYALRRFMEGLGLGVEMAVFYDLKDDGVDIYEEEHNFGLITNDLSRKKPAYGAVQRLARFMVPYFPVDANPVTVYLPDSRPAQWPVKKGLELAGADQIRNYAFGDVRSNPDRPAVVMLWSIEPAGGDLSPRVGNVKIDLPDPVNEVRVYDLHADTWTTHEVQNEGGIQWVRNLRIPDSPIALILE